MMDVLRGSAPASSRPLYVASLHFPFRIPNLTFTGWRPRDSQTPQQRLSVAAAAAAGNRTGTKSSRLSFSLG